MRISYRGGSPIQFYIITYLSILTNHKNNARTTIKCHETSKILHILDYCPPGIWTWHKSFKSKNNMDKDVGTFYITSLVKKYCITLNMISYRLLETISITHMLFFEHRMRRGWLPYSSYTNIIEVYHGQ